MSFIAYISLLICICLISMLSLPLPPILVPSTIISFIGIVITVRGLLSRRYKNRSLYLMIFLCYFVGSYIVFGIQTSRFANAAQEIDCRNNMKSILRSQIYGIKPHNIRIVHGDLYDLVHNHSVIPSTITKEQGMRLYCKHYYFSLLYTRRYYAINQYISGKPISNFSANAGSVVCIYEYDNLDNSSINMTVGEYDKSLVNMHPSLMLDGSLYRK